MLCGIFGVLGIHHFYLGNMLHGLVDLSLLVLAVIMFASGFDGIGIVLLIVDAVHTIVVFYLLITEQQRDSAGRLVTSG
jgi:TM2 domain-containing membrane protein YozV